MELIQEINFKFKNYKTDKFGSEKREMRKVFMGRESEYDDIKYYFNKKKDSIIFDLRDSQIPTLSLIISIFALIMSIMSDIGIKLLEMYPTNISTIKAASSIVDSSLVIGLAGLVSVFIYVISAKLNRVQKKKYEYICDLLDSIENEI